MIHLLWFFLPSGLGIWFLSYKHSILDKEFLHRIEYVINSQKEIKSEKKKKTLVDFIVYVYMFMLINSIFFQESKIFIIMIMLNWFFNKNFIIWTWALGFLWNFQKWVSNILNGSEYFLAVSSLFFMIFEPFSKDIWALHYS